MRNADFGMGNADFGMRIDGSVALINPKSAFRNRACGVYLARGRFGVVALAGDPPTLTYAKASRLCPVASATASTV